MFSPVGASSRLAWKGLGDDHPGLDAKLPFALRVKDTGKARSVYRAIAHRHLAVTVFP